MKKYIMPMTKFVNMIEDAEMLAGSGFEIKVGDNEPVEISDDPATNPAGAKNFNVWDE